jgi:D-alanyl-lipoteichoic acid acyltransferase DltB (MBOAT superfamily)
VSQTLDTLQTTLEAPAPAKTGSWAISVRHVLILAQLVLAANVIRLYAIEGSAFFQLFVLAAAGSLLHAALPLRFRLPFFVALSIAGVFVVFAPADGLWLMGAGALLIGLCHLPVPLIARVAAIVAVAAALAVSRAGGVAAPWSAAVWPILGSMFMFRLVLYLLAIKNKQQDGSIWGAIAYFFMLPNLVFPLFPVVDYQTFRRTHYDRPAIGIYEQGLAWISRGLVHLLLYRFVYYNVLNDPVDVVRLSGVLQSMLGTFLLYLRVSGQFHLIVGILHLFGFRLPETHKLYYLAHSFTELWRRINIYWTDFMMKAVFYPTYFKVKRLGPSRALVVSTTAVFVTTWLLHSYQWFWLRGGFPLTMPDTLFWGILGALVVLGGLRELNAPKKPKGRASAWNWRTGLRAAMTFSMFCLLWSLWSADSVSQWIWMMAAAGNVDLAGVVIAVAAFALVLVLGARDWKAPAPARAPWVDAVFGPASRSLAALLLLVVLSQPGVQAAAPRSVANGLKSLHATGLNVRDSALQQRGYYEQLDVRGQLNERVADAIATRNANWDTFATTGVLRERPHDMLTRDLLPSKQVVWNGQTLSTNRWGMRDREYERDKPARTLRIALLGPSFVMGSGVSDGETFENLVEARLQREFRNPAYDSVEILNFAVEGHTVPEQVAMLQDRVLAFAPDLVIATHYYPARSWTERYLRKIVWNGANVSDPALRALLLDAGLGQSEGDIAVPFETGRSLARLVGYHPRMPMAESVARIRWATDGVVEWALGRFADVTREQGATPVVLGLNAVIDDAPDRMPNQEAIRKARLNTIDLFDVYPANALASLRAAPWDEHPNAAGHRLIAERLYPEIVRLLHSTAASAKR